MKAFDYQLLPRILFGVGEVKRLGEVAREYVAPKDGLTPHQEEEREKPVVLLVSDPGVVTAGIYDRGRSSLESAGFEVHGFHGFAENPNCQHVDRGVELARKIKPSLIVGLGGGSSMDCAKGINFIYSCGGRIKDYWGVGKATGPMLPFIAVPTTSGTGSETQSFALISDAETHVKMACGDSRAACKVAILDPELTYTQPAKVTALTGIDAITHALESYVCNKRNSMSECFAMEAWRLLSSGFSQVLVDPTNSEARASMQLGASFAGMAIESSMLGIAHSLANPLTAALGTPHGQAVGMMMPHVIAFNSEVVADRYEQLLKTAGWDLSEQEPALKSDESGCAVDLEPSIILARQVRSWLCEADLATHLRELPGWPAGEDDERELLRRLSEEAAKQWTAGFNPRPVKAEDLMTIYRNAL